MGQRRFLSESLYFFDVNFHGYGGGIVWKIFSDCGYMPQLILSMNIVSIQLWVSTQKQFITIFSHPIEVKFVHQRSGHGGEEFSDSLNFLIISFIDKFSRSGLWNIYLCGWVPSLPAYVISMTSLLNPVTLCLGRIRLSRFDISLLFSLRRGHGVLHPPMYYQAVRFKWLFNPII